MWIVNQLVEIIFLLVTVVAMGIGAVLFFAVIVALSPVLAAVALIGAIGAFFLWVLGVIGGKRG